MDRVGVGPVKGLRIAIAAFILSLVLFGAVIAGGVYFSVERSKEGAETHQAICALVSDLEERAEGTKRFLNAHPHGIPGLATAAQLQESVQNQERTRKALSAVSC